MIEDESFRARGEVATGGWDQPSEQVRVGATESNHRSYDEVFRDGGRVKTKQSRFFESDRKNIEEVGSGTKRENEHVPPIRSLKD